MKNFARLFFALLLLCAPAAADDFSVDDVWFVRTDDGGYALRATLSIAQPERLDVLLQGGYEVPLRFDLIFVQRRNWWFDKEAGDIIWRGVMSYDNLGDRYVLQVGGRRRLYPSLQALLLRVSNLRGEASASPGFAAIFARENMEVEARFLLEEGGLPEPVKIELLLSNEWDTASAWRAFPLQVRSR